MNFQVSLKWPLEKSLMQIGVTSLLFNCSVAVASAETDYILIRNKLNLNRLNEVVCVYRSNFGSIPYNSYPIFRQGSNKCISQLIDVDNNGQWDEVLVEVTLKARSKDKLLVEWVKTESYPAFDKATNIRFSFKSKTEQPEKEINFLERQRGFSQNIANPLYQMEGPGIENDKVAFRCFFDKRNGKDIYGKLISAPVLDEVGLSASWHTLQDWGMDILRTGNSLGAGALGIKQQGKIFRLADADKSTFSALYEGSLKASFKLDFFNWDVGEGLKPGTEQISLTKSDYFYHNQIRLALAENQQLISGIANFGIGTLVYKKHNKKFSSVSLYGAQADGTKTNLGLAILFETNQYAGHVTTLATDSIPNTTYVTLNQVKNGLLGLRFFACWEKTDTSFSTKEGFNRYLQNAADRIANPIKTTVIQPIRK